MVCNGCSEVKKCTLTKTVYDLVGALRQGGWKRYQSPSRILATEGELARLKRNSGAALVKQGTVHPSDLPDT